MATPCPRCEGALEAVRFMEMPPDGSSDEVTLHLLRCPSCGQVGLGIYEESRRGGLGEDHWRYHAHETSAASWTELDRLVAACPDPRNPRCGCASHGALAKLDAGGRWAGVDEHLGKHLG